MKNIPQQETLEEACKRIKKELQYADFDYTSFKQGVKWQQEQIIDFLHSEITERRGYSSSKMCEKVIEFIKKFKKK